MESKRYFVSLFLLTICPLFIACGSVAHEDPDGASLPDAIAPDAAVPGCAVVTCDPNATCDDSSGTGVCTCNAGYEGDGAACANIDECTTMTAACDPYAACIDGEGSYTCQCPAGTDDTMGDGSVCVPIIGSVTFSYTGDIQTYVLPPFATSVSIVAFGAQGQARSLIRYPDRVKRTRRAGGKARNRARTFGTLSVEQRRRR